MNSSSSICYCSKYYFYAFHYELCKKHIFFIDVYHKIKFWKRKINMKTLGVYFNENIIRNNNIMRIRNWSKYSSSSNMILSFICFVYFSYDSVKTIFSIYLFLESFANILWITQIFWVINIHFIPIKFINDKCDLS